MIPLVAFLTHRSPSEAVLWSSRALASQMWVKSRLSGTQTSDFRSDGYRQHTRE